MPLHPRITTHRLSSCLLAAAFPALLCVAAPAWALGGPPMVTDDPETPGDGNWEINIAAIRNHMHGETEVELPVADVNYGLGEHVQLKLEAPLNHVHESGEGWRNGLGSVGAGIKWRFIDHEDAGFDMSIYPQLSSDWHTVSGRRSLADPGEQLFLPVEAAMEIGGFEVVGEVGRNFDTAGPEQWLGGMVLTHKCGIHVECMAELHETVNPHNVQSLVNFGLNWELNEEFSVLAAVGREYGPDTEAQEQSRIYFGLQIRE